MSYELATMYQCLCMAGTNVNSNLSGSTILSKFYDESAASLNAQTRRDWLSLSGSTLTNFSGIIGETIAAMVAMKCINYDMSGYTSRTEAQTMLDILKDLVVRNIEALKDDKIKQAVT